MSNAEVLNPKLSEYIHQNGFNPTYKDGKRFAVCLSHDIDFLFEPKNKNSFLISTIETIKRRKWKEVSYNFNNLIGKMQHPSWVLDKLIELEIKSNLKSSYYFLSLQQGEEDYNYSIDSVKKYFPILESYGCEIGLHGGHAAYNNVNKIQSERRLLESVYGKSVIGYRNHYLRFKTPDTWHHLKQLGFEYDTTFGYPDQIGFRNGMCYPFRPYDAQKEQYIDILELPLLVMDVTFFKYMGLDVDNSFRLFMKVFNDVKRLNGVLTIVWHNNCYAGDHRLLYDKIFAVIQQADDAWIATSKELSDWWKKNNLHQMEEIINNKILKA